MARPKILLVDDDPAVLELMQELLAELNADFSTATNGRQALELAASQQPDLVITDLKMPDVDGMALIHGLKAARASALVIVVTGYGGREQHEQADAAQVFDFVDKPFMVDSLLPTAKLALDSRSDGDGPAPRS